MIQTPHLDALATSPHGVLLERHCEGTTRRPNHTWPVRALDAWVVAPAFLLAMAMIRCRAVMPDRSDRWPQNLARTRFWLTLACHLRRPHSLAESGSWHRSHLSLARALSTYPPPAPPLLRFPSSSCDQHARAYIQYSTFSLLSCDNRRRCVPRNVDLRTSCCRWADQFGQRSLCSDTLPPSNPGNPPTHTHTHTHNVLNHCLRSIAARNPYAPRPVHR